MTSEELIKGLRKLCGYVENGSDTKVKIGQDDATREWSVHVGNRWYHGPSMEQALEAAIEDHVDD